MIRMGAFSNWQKYVVRQRRPETGCIPTGYEMILHAADCKGVNFETFQDEFDLDKNLKHGEQPQNNFESVAKAIQTKYPYIHFNHVGYAKGEGQTKLAMVEQMISRRLPVLISLALTPFNRRGWHIMPVVDLSHDALTFLWRVDQNGNLETMTLDKKDFVAIHERYEGGNDIAYLEKLKSDE